VEWNDLQINPSEMSLDILYRNFDTESFFGDVSGFPTDVLVNQIFGSAWH